MGAGSGRTAEEEPVDGRPGIGPRLRGLRVGDEPAGWIEAGFTVTGCELDIGGVRISLVGGHRRGVLGWELEGPSHDDHRPDGSTVDGIPTTLVAPGEVAEAAPGGSHPNGVVGVDHVVVATGDLPRTLDHLAARGYRPRRTRDVPGSRPPRRQVFLWAGPVILEVVGPTRPDPAAGPASVWGLALVTADLEATAGRLGDRMSKPRDAVQPGRRIASIRTKLLDISVPLALMSPHHPS